MPKLLKILVDETKGARDLYMLSIAFKRLWVKGLRLMVVGALIVAIVEAVIFTYTPKLGRYLIDAISQGKALGWQHPMPQSVFGFHFASYYSAIIWLTILTAVFGTMTYNAYNIQTGLARNATYRSAVRFATECFGRYLSLPMAYHVRSKRGQFLRIEEAVRNSQDFLYNALFKNTLRTLLTIIMVLGTTYAKDVRLFSICAFWIVVGLYTNMMFGSSVSKQEKAAWRIISKANERSQDVVNNILEVKMCGREADEVERRRRDAEQQLPPLERAGMLWRVLTTIQNHWQWAGFLTCMFYVVLKGVFAGTFTVGEVLQFTILYGMLFAGFMDCLFKFLDALKLCPKLEDIKSLLEELLVSMDSPGATEFPGFRHELEFRDVSFTYPDSNGMGVGHVNLTIPKGKITILVGKTGCGKSTLSKIVMRFMDPDSGAIYADGVDIRRYNQRSYQRMFTTLSQDGSLFNRTVEENIAYKRPEASKEEIIRAAGIAQAHEFISRMPQGYQTVIYEQAANISGGQKRRIALARAVLAWDAEVVILDEPTTGLDPKTSSEFMDELVSVFAGKTILVVTHDRKIMGRADQIVFIEDGYVCHAGDHDHLLGHCDGYRELVAAS